MCGTGFSLQSSLLESREFEWIQAAVTDSFIFANANEMRMKFSTLPDFFGNWSSSPLQCKKKLEIPQRNLKPFC
jgi:hypothetical protein